MARSTERAKQLLTLWRGEDYAFGLDVLDRTGAFTKSLGDTALVVVASLGREWADRIYAPVADSLRKSGVRFSTIRGSAPNSPREDLYRIANEVSKTRPASIVAVGGGSTLDIAKAASLLATYSVEQVQEHLGASPADASTVEPWFGTGMATRIINATGIAPIPVVAVETVSSSGSHLTKYANITDPLTGQKKLIIDMAIVPPKAVFDFGVTTGCPEYLTLDGGLDGMSHMWEVFMGATGQSYYKKVKEIAYEGMSLIVENLPLVMKDPKNIDARIALGYGTDLGGYAIMVGGTNGGHLGSFSLVDVLAHGRACAVLNPYYTVLFADAIEDQLRTAGAIYRAAGYIVEDIDRLEGRALAEAVAQGMIAFSRRIGFPATLAEAGATEKHIERMIAAAKNPQLESKLKNMPTPMDSSKGDVDTYMRPVLEAAFSGDFGRIRPMTKA